jgi:chromatin remodeling complex protein RSC6
MAEETVKQRDKRELDLQLDRELEGTFPASDPLKITRFSSPILPPEESSKK